MSDLQVQAERDYDYAGKQVVVRVKWRRPPTRRWSKVVVVPQEGQTVGEVMNMARKIAEHVEAERA